MSTSGNKETLNMIESGQETSRRMWRCLDRTLDLWVLEWVGARQLGQDGND